MAIVTSGTVLVTGANGYVAMWVVKYLLERGYAVRAAVRSADKGVHLTQTFAAFPGKLEIALVPDITVDGAFDSAVKGVDAIMHIASPVHLNAVEPEDIIGPAVMGTTSLFNSVVAHGSSVKRIVFTSTCGAVAHFNSSPKIYDQSDWNEFAVHECQEKGRDASPLDKYCASKVLAEKAAWETFEKHKASGFWDLVVVLPPHVFGPVLYPVSSPETIHGSMQEWYDLVFKEGAIPEHYLQDGFCWIDVRDLADAHLRAINVLEAAGERIIVTAGTFRLQDWPIHARQFSDKVIAVNDAYNAATSTAPYQFVTTKMQNILGIHPRSKADTTADIMKDFAARGWLESLD